MIFYHHYGKILKRIHKDDDACIQFRKALEYEANAPHSLLQLARLTKNSEDKVLFQRKDIRHTCFNNFFDLCINCMS